MALSNNLADMSRYTAELGQGTTVRIYLPTLVREQEESAPLIDDTRNINNGTEQILVVEDDDDVRAHSIQILDELVTGFSKRLMPAALDILQQQPDIKLLFTDVGLPGGMNGRQLAKKRVRYVDVKGSVYYGLCTERNCARWPTRPWGQPVTKPSLFPGWRPKLRELLEDHAGPRRILVVEDELLVRMVAVETLEALGYQTEEAASATEAINKVRVAGAASMQPLSTSGFRTAAAMRWLRNSVPCTRSCRLLLPALTANLRSAIASLRIRGSSS